MKRRSAAFSGRRPLPQQFMQTTDGAPAPPLHPYPSITSLFAALTVSELTVPQRHSAVLPPPLALALGEQTCTTAIECNREEPSSLANSSSHENDSLSPALCLRPALHTSERFRTGFPPPRVAAAVNPRRSDSHDTGPLKSPRAL